MEGSLVPDFSVKSIFGNYDIRFINNLNYAIKDKQDLLAMCLIEYASKSESENNKNIVVDDGISEKLNQINSLLESNI